MKNNIKLIVIDDEISVIEVIKAYLGSCYKIEGVCSSKEGIAKIKNGSFDLLILDYYIDEKDGTDIINEIRKFNKDIYILLLTGYSEKISFLQSIKSLDIQNYCEKTANFENIISSIESAIDSIIS